MFVENQDIINKPIIIDEDEVQKAYQQQIPQQQFQGSTTWHNCRRLIYVPRSAQKGYSVGHWPIPEAFWPDLQCSTLVCSILNSICVISWSGLMPEWAYAILQLRSSVICLLAFHIFIFSLETLGPIWTKLGKNGPCMVSNLNYLYIQ